MITKLCTDKEQSKVLMNYVPITSADMFWAPESEVPMVRCSELTGDDIPAWSLPALLRLIQSPILTDHRDGSWNCAAFNKNNHFIEDYTSNDPIDACYGLLKVLGEW